MEELPGSSLILEEVSAPIMVENERQETIHRSLGKPENVRIVTLTPHHEVSSIVHQDRLYDIVREYIARLPVKIFAGRDMRLPLSIETLIVHPHEVKDLGHLKHTEYLLEMDAKMTISEKFTLVVFIS